MRTTNNLVEGLPNYSTVLPPEVKCFSEFLRAAGYYCTNNQKTDYQFEAPVTAWDECSVNAHWRNRKPGQPFFSIINFITTHESRIWTQAGEPLLVDEAKVPIPPYYPDHPGIRRDVARKYSNIVEMDLQMGLIMEQLESDGLLDSTIVFFYSDHGGMLPREKRELYETGLRVPLVIRFPGKKNAGTICNELVSFVDFAPTVLSLAGVEVPSYMQGQAFLGSQKAPEPRTYIYGARDRMDTEYDMVRAVRDQRFKYLKNYRPELPFVQEIQYRKQIPMMNVLYEYDTNNLFEGVQKLWWRKTKPAEELYDVDADPWEFNNLADDPAYADKLDELRGALAAWQAEVGDKGFIPEKEMLRQMWGGDTQPVTAEVEFVMENGLCKMFSATEGVSIAWQPGSDQASGHWNLYTGPVPLQPGESIRAQAIRIGYKHSRSSEFSLNQP